MQTAFHLPCFLFSDGASKAEDGRGIEEFGKGRRQVNMLKIGYWLIAVQSSKSEGVSLTDGGEELASTPLSREEGIRCRRMTWTLTFGIGKTLHLMQGSIPASREE